MGHGVGSTSRENRSAPSRSFLTTYLNGLPTCFLIDSGSQSTFVSSKVYFRIPKRYRPPIMKSRDVITMADGESRLKILGNVMMPVKVYGTNFNFPMTVVDMDSMDGIWGMDFLGRFKCDFKMSTQTLVFNGMEYPMQTTKHDLLPHSVKLTQQTTIQAGGEVIIAAHLNRPFRTHQDITFEPSMFFVKKNGVLPAKSLTTQSRRRTQTPVQLFNPHGQEITLPKGTIVGYAFPATVKEDIEPEASTGAASMGTSSRIPDDELLDKLEDEMPSHLEQLYEDSCAELNTSQKIRLASILIEFRGLFHSLRLTLGRQTSCLIP